MGELKLPGKPFAISKLEVWEAYCPFLKSQMARFQIRTSWRMTEMEMFGWLQMMG
jgi:hypothetical protein